MHEHFVDLEHSVYLFDQRHGRGSEREKCRVGMERVPVLLGIVFAGVSDKVDKSVLPGGRVVVRHPIANDVESVFGL